MMKQVEQMRNEEESNSSNVSSSDGNDFRIIHMHEDDLKSAKMNMDEVTEENKRLKFTLSQIMKDYQSLKMNFNDLVQHDIDDDQFNKSKDSSPPMSVASEEDESELVCCLSLGRFSGETKKEEKKSNQEIKKQELDHRVDGLELGLECKFHLCDSTPVTKNSSSDNSLGHESKEEENNETNASYKSLKRTRTSSEDDEILVQNHLKKPRVSVRAVCDTQTMNDGCQWRKYGQKIAKGNPCPRAYYRCTVSSSCPVRKQVQRCAENMSILITTYEGTHNHPLPASATNMASATTSAVAMLNCGSSTSSPSSQEVFSTSSTSSNFNKFKFTSANTLPTPIFPRTSISTSQSHPTVILDLTTPNNTSTPYNKYDFSSLYSSSTWTSSTCLNFSSVPSSNSGSLGSSKNLFQSRNRTASYSQPYINYNNKIEEEFLVDGIDAAAKAITRDPTFQSALAAAITSFVGNGGISSTNVQEKKSGQNVKWDENFNLSFSQPSTRSGVTACSMSYLNNFIQSLNSQQK